MSVVASGVSGELQDFGGHVLADGGEVHGSTTTNASLAFLGNHGLEARDRELEASLGGGTLATTAASVLLFHAELGDRLCTFRYSMLSDISRKDQTHRSLNLTRGERQLVADFNKFLRLSNEAIGEILNQRINDRDG